MIVKADHSVIVGAHATMRTKRVYRADGVTIEVVYRNRPADVFPGLRFDAAWAFFMGVPPSWAEQRPVEG